MILLVASLFLLVCAEVEDKSVHFYFGPYEAGPTVNFQDILDGLPKICGRYESPMRKMFRTNSNGDEDETYIGRRTDSGKFIYNEAVMNEEGKVLIRSVVNEEPQLLKVSKGYKVVANPILQDKTEFSKGGTQFMPVLVYNCLGKISESGDRTLFATIGSHDRYQRKIMFIDENCENKTVPDETTHHPDGYRILELDIIKNGSGNSALYACSFSILIIVALRSLLDL